MLRFGCVIVLSLLLALSGQAQLKQVKPGWNLFSVQQDEQLGQEAAQQIHQRMRIVHNAELETYLGSLLNKLRESPRARYFGETNESIPYSIHAVYDKNLNAFSLPGGPIFLNTGLIEAADNEAQLAGAISHEMSHVVLRHATNQLTKRNLIALPAMLAGAVAGNSLLGQLAQLGLGLGANSVLLKFSRSDESEADYNGAQIMADAGYNPIEMAYFFEKLEAKDHSGRVAQFLSDHPNPGNRVRAVEDEVRQMPRRKYTEGQTVEFRHIREVALHLSPPVHLTGKNENDGHAPEAPAARPSNRLVEYRGQGFSLSHPDNWKVFDDGPGKVATIAPRDGPIMAINGHVVVGYGVQVSYYLPQQEIGINLSRDTEALIRQFEKTNPGIRVSSDSRSVPVGKERGLETEFRSRSQYRGEKQVDVLFTAARPEGLFYLVFFSPEREFDQARATFRDILRSVKFP
jgi:Zn-dependent protease with chaperone function